MYEEKFAKLTAFAPVVVRVAMSLVFIWFGFKQFGDPQAWTVWLPSWTAMLPVSDVNFVLLNAGFEVLFGLLLLSGFYTRFVALLLGLHMLGIVSSIGITEIGVRDFGLAFATLSVFLYGADRFTLDKFFERKESKIV